MPRFTADCRGASEKGGGGGRETIDDDKVEELIRKYLRM
jgi:hypothetical protein